MVLTHRAFGGPSNQIAFTLASCPDQVDGATEDLLVKSYRSLEAVPWDWWPLHAFAVSIRLCPRPIHVIDVGAHVGLYAAAAAAAGAASVVAVERSAYYYPTLRWTALAASKHHHVIVFPVCCEVGPGWPNLCLSDALAHANRPYCVKVDVGDASCFRPVWLSITALLASRDVLMWFFGVPGSCVQGVRRALAAARYSALLCPDVTCPVPDDVITFEQLVSLGMPGNTWSLHSEREATELSAPFVHVLAIRADDGDWPACSFWPCGASPPATRATQPTVPATSSQPSNWPAADPGEQGAKVRAGLGVGVFLDPHSWQTTCYGARTVWAHRLATRTPTRVAVQPHGRNAARARPPLNGRDRRTQGQQRASSPGRWLRIPPTPALPVRIRRAAPPQLQLWPEAR